MPAKPTTPTVPHVRIPKSLYDALLAGRFTANQLKVVLCVVRFTIGHKAQAGGARISRRFIAERTQTNQRNVRRVRDGLIAEGVLVQVQPAAGRQAAMLALQTDSRRWGIHAPNGQSLLARTGADKDTSLLALSDPPTWRSGAPTNGGSHGASSEELSEVLLLNEQDSDSPSDEASLSALNTDAPGLSVDEGRDLVADYLATHTGKRTFAPDDES